eukprot:1188949-Prorocentrum_minimum.AAC.1
MTVPVRPPLGGFVEGPVSLKGPTTIDIKASSRFQPNQTPCTQHRVLAPVGTAQDNILSDSEAYGRLDLIDKSPPPPPPRYNSEIKDSPEDTAKFSDQYDHPLMFIYGMVLSVWLAFLVQGWASKQKVRGTS